MRFLGSFLGDHRDQPMAGWLPFRFHGDFIASWWFFIGIYPLKMVMYSGFIVDLLVDLPIENDDLMGFYWDTLWFFNSLPWKWPI